VTVEIAALIVLADEMILSGKVDTYILSLLAASLYNLNRIPEAQKYADEVVKYQLPTGNVTNSLTSITSSEGWNLEIETTAIAAIAWLNEQSRYSANIQKAIDWIV